MQVTLKLFATLSQFLPAHARQNAFQEEISETDTVRDLLARHNVPMPMCHLILVNGVYLAPARAAEARLAPGDTVSVWPPVAGG